MKRPLLGVALVYTMGVLLAGFVTLPATILIGTDLGAGVLALIWVFMLRGKRLTHAASGVLLGFFLFLAGLTNLSLRTASVSPCDLRTLLGPTREDAKIRGNLVETPYHRIYENDDNTPIRTLAVVEVSGICREGKEWETAVGQVAVSTTGTLPETFHGGQEVEIVGRIYPPKGRIAEGLFDYRAYLHWQGIYYQLHANSSNEWRLAGLACDPPFADKFCSWAQGALSRGLPEEDESLRLLWSMTLGWKTGLNGEVAEPFMRSGTMHIFAISGLHIALISLILIKLLQVCKVPRGICGLVVIPMIWMYTGLTGWQASAIRSTIMMTIVIAGWSLKRPSDLLNSLAAAAFIILLWEPRQLFQTSFQLSFLVVLSLVLFTPVLTELRDHWLAPEPLLPPQLVPWWRTRLVKLARMCSSGFITSLAAWLGSTPLIACYFHLFSPISLLANLIIVPLSSLALMANLASLLVIGWFPACAELFNHSGWLWMTLMIWLSKTFATVKGACFHLPTPTPAAFLLYYLIVLALMLGWLRHPRWRKWAVAGLALAALICGLQWFATERVTRLVILPFGGGGEAFYLDAPGHTADGLVDCGDETGAQYVTVPFLKAQGVNRLPNLFLTHGDSRHVRGATKVYDTFAVQHACLSPVRFRSQAYRELQSFFEEQQGVTRTVQRGAFIRPWSVLHPDPQDSFPRADDKTLVLRAEIEGTSLLLLSDLGKAGQNALANRYPDARAEIVVTGLPTADEPLASGFLELLQPALIIVTDAEYPSLARASRKIQERLDHCSRPVIYTHDTGALTITFRNGDWLIEGVSGTRISKSEVTRFAEPVGSKRPG